jgi:UDP-glucose 4-epimerase
VKLLFVQSRDGPAILLFGLGVVGAAIDRGLRLRFPLRSRDLPYDWQDPSLRQRQREAIAAALPPDQRLAIVWAAGAGGFGSSSADMAEETRMVTELIDWAQALQAGREVDFHLVSSAGGLFEGQTHCTSSSVPNPLRPYGEGKLQQEAHLRKAEFRRRCIYRPSSVYGVGRSQRLGLVAMLARNALIRNTTRIFGNPNTLRDYVLADDIGAFMARRIVTPGGTDEVMTLASGRSASVREVVELVGAKVMQPMLLQFDPHPANARNMSFLPSSLPSDWRRTSLASGIAKVVDGLRRRIA